MKQLFSLFAAFVMVGLLSTAQASTLGIDEVTSLRSTTHNVLEASDDAAEAELSEDGKGGESTRLAHWLVINENTKWQFDDEVLALEENFFNTEYEVLAEQTAQNESDTLAVFFDVQEGKYKGTAQGETAKK
jgi:hypothetical protein